ncbi:MAG: hypothetical protein J6A77_11915 [Lachnospiraceae bacterium]|nr:hypothetical protein [Lachnospiraceae bacterium]
MKKLTALLLTVCLVLSMAFAGCGEKSSGSDTQKTETNKTDKADTSQKEESKEDKKNTDSSKDNSSEAEKEEEKKEEKQEDSGASYTVPTYEDFTDFSYFYDLATETKVYYSHPVMRPNNEYIGYIYDYDQDVNVIVCKQDFDVPAYDGPIEGLLAECAPVFLDLVGKAGTFYLDHETDLLASFDYTSSIVTLDSGIEAVKFEGSRETWEPGSEYHIYGYCFVYGAFNMTFGYVIENLNGEDNRPAYEAEMRDIVDRMVTTVRDTQ